MVCQVCPLINFGTIAILYEKEDVPPIETRRRSLGQRLRPTRLPPGPPQQPRQKTRECLCRALCNCQHPTVDASAGSSLPACQRKPKVALELGVQNEERISAVLRVFGENMQAGKSRKRGREVSVAEDQGGCERPWFRENVWELW